MKKSKYLLFSLAVLFCVSSSHGITITVKPAMGNQITLDVAANDSVASVKQKIAEQEGVPASQQGLMFKGEQLEDHKTLKDYKIRNNSMLHLVLKRTRG